MTRLSTLAAIVALGLAAACGQQANAPQADVTASEPVAPVTAAAIPDADFVQHVANSDAFEVQVAQVAIDHATRNDVRAFARMLKTAHTQTTLELTTIATGAAMAAPGGRVDGEHQAKLDALRGSTGDALDTLFLSQQVEAHEAAIKLFEDYTAQAGEGALKQWAVATLPALRDHLSRAHSLQSAS